MTIHLRVTGLIRNQEPAISWTACGLVGDAAAGGSYDPEAVTCGRCKRTKEFEKATRAGSPEDVGVSSEAPEIYFVPAKDEVEFQGTEDELVARALQIMESRIIRESEPLRSPEMTRKFLRLRMGGLEQEVFGLMLLDTRHRVITVQDMFTGTIDGAAVYPREVVKEALRHNAAAAILYHNHPSGNPEPSQADITLTRRLKEALALVDIRVLDHMIVTGTTTQSLAEMGHM